MIERLMNMERPYGEPEYSSLSEEISRLRNQLNGLLDQQGVRWLEQMADAYMKQEDAVLRDAFAEGFWSAVELMLEFERRKSDMK